MLKTALIKHARQKSFKALHSVRNKVKRKMSIKKKKRQEKKRKALSASDTVDRETGSKIGNIIMKDGLL